MRKSLFQAVPKPLISDSITNAIEKAIVKGILKPGQKLFLNELASQFQVSQIPVREALNRLAAMGLILRRPNQGTFVVEFSLDELEAILEVRDALEGLAVRLSAARATAEDIHNLRKLITQMDKAASAKNTIQLCEVDILFHRTLWACTRNPFLEKSLAALILPMFGFNMASHLPQIELASYARKHEWIVDARATGDGDLAERQIVILSDDTRKVIAQGRQNALAGPSATAESPRSQQRWDSERP
jgi:DNA-binding GntR family transcriptional regulator